jgi:hypothetical protein
MDIWKRTLVNLSTVGKVMASWQLESGVTFFMFIPNAEAMGEETITKESDVRFDEIVSLDILNTMQLGGLSVSNDIEMCRVALERDKTIRLVSIQDGVRVTADR